jgi:hypothetical protein
MIYGKTHCTLLSLALSYEQKKNVFKDENIGCGPGDGQVKY